MSCAMMHHHWYGPAWRSVAAKRLVLQPVSTGHTIIAGSLCPYKPPEQGKGMICIWAGLQLLCACWCCTDGSLAFPAWPHVIENPMQATSKGRHMSSASLIEKGVAFVQP